jgi:hypothetical protein
MRSIHALYLVHSRLSLPCVVDIAVVEISVKTSKELAGESEALNFDRKWEPCLALDSERLNDDEELTWSCRERHSPEATKAKLSWLVKKVWL